VSEVPEGTEEIQLQKDPAPSRSYDLVLQNGDEVTCVIPLQTPEAKNWLFTAADFIRIATAATLVPVVPGFPTVSVNLKGPGGTRELKYYRKVRGRISGPVIHEMVVHCLGWVTDDAEFVAAIYPDGSVVLD